MAQELASPRLAPWRRPFHPMQPRPRRATTRPSIGARPPDTTSWTSRALQHGHARFALHVFSGWPRALDLQHYWEREAQIRNLDVRPGDWGPDRWLRPQPLGGPQPVRSPRGAMAARGWPQHEQTAVELGNMLLQAALKLWEFSSDSGALTSLEHPADLGRWPAFGAFPRCNGWPGCPARVRRASTSAATGESPRSRRRS